MEIESRLELFDKELSLMNLKIKDRLEMYIVGGGALYLLDKITRVTYDVDAFFMYQLPDEISKLMRKYDINTSVNAYNDYFAHDYKKRAVKLKLTTKVIDFYTLSLEDLVISKIIAGRPKDLHDINSKEIVQTINWNVLESIKQSVAEDMLSPRARNEFLGMYQIFVEENKSERTSI